MKERPRFLVLRGGAIGDFIMTLPVLEALRNRWPQAEIELVGYPHIAALATVAGLADRVRSLDEAGMARFFARSPEFEESQVAYIRSFDLIVSYLHDPGAIVRSNLYAAGAGHLIYGSPMIAEDHAIEHLLKPLEELAVYPDAPCPHLVLNDEVTRKGVSWLESQELHKGAVAIHPGSGSPKKNWPVDRFIALARHLRDERSKEPFFVIGEADRTELEALEATQAEFAVLEKQSLVDVAAVLSQCGFYVGNDSGITHLAASVGIPVVALFGPSDASKWGPRGERVRVVTAGKGALDDISLESVIESVDALGC